MLSQPKDQLGGCGVPHEIRTISRGPLKGDSKKARKEHERKA